MHNTVSLKLTLYIAGARLLKEALEESVAWHLTFLLMSKLGAREQGCGSGSDSVPGYRQPTI